MVIMASGIARGRVQQRRRGDGVAQHGGHRNGAKMNFRGFSVARPH